MSKAPDPRKVPPRPATPAPARPAAPRPASAPKAGHAPARPDAKTGGLTTTKSAGLNGAAPVPASGLAKKTAPAAKTATAAKTPHRIPSGHAKTAAAAAAEAETPVSRPRRRKLTLYLGGLLVAGAVVAMVFFGMGKKPRKIVAPPPPPPAAAAYTEVGPLRLDGRDYKLVASVAVQVAKKDLEWAQQNNGNFYRLLERELLTVDPRMGREPEGLTRLQDSLKKLLNDAGGGERIQQIWITEFAYLPDTLYDK